MHHTLIITGKVIAGLGEGRRFMSLSGYRKQFIKKLGIDPYKGTLNLKLSGENALKLARIEKMRGITVRGFRKGKKTFGAVECYKARILGAGCALIIPKRSRHTDVAEVVAQWRLRSVLGLEDGDRVKMQVAV
ncbi:MAG: CTP-dependent riboflavin kinase [Candidatus Marsarchaeota archaeon]|nr:CTP-dependent riboflavin kinase [Candidatus Marsarchaeota archaeon]MCL5412787.1 CTP-dependent riboflavin kinase [Candidatus Marsarchaeota archaeon]